MAEAWLPLIPARHSRGHDHPAQQNVPLEDVQSLSTSFSPRKTAGGRPDRSTCRVVLSMALTELFERTCIEHVGGCEPSAARLPDSVPEQIEAVR